MVFLDYAVYKEFKLIPNVKLLFANSLSLEDYPRKKIIKDFIKFEVCQNYIHEISILVKTLSGNLYEYKTPSNFVNLSHANKKWIFFLIPSKDQKVIKFGQIDMGNLYWKYLNNNTAILIDVCDLSLLCDATRTQIICLDHLKSINVNSWFRAKNPT